jgi:ligand-binding SRPBCC domain-containing protein
MHHSYHSEQWLPYPVELVFAFFANPGNLPRLMPRWQKTRIDQASFTAPPPYPASDRVLASKTIAAGAGTRMLISFRPFPFSPIRAQWQAEITQFVWNDHFCDHLLRGPFSHWNHCHRLQSETRANTPGTLLCDDVEYELPFGKLGDLARRLFIARQLRSIFAYRHAQASKLLAHATTTG